METSSSHPGHGMWQEGQGLYLKKCVLSTFLVAMTELLARSVMREKLPVVQGVNKSHPSQWGRRGGRHSVREGSRSCAVLPSGWLSMRRNGTLASLHFASPLLLSLLFLSPVLDSKHRTLCLLDLCLRAKPSALWVFSVNTLELRS